MNKIITFYDCDYNGKTGKKIFQKYSLGKCVLDFDNNQRIKMKNIQIKDKEVIFENKIIQFNLINIVIFNYGEDSSLSIEYLKKSRNIYDILFNKYKNIHIFNNPYNNSIIVNTLETYDILKKSKFIKVPLYGSLIHKDFDYKKLSYPIIISLKRQSGGKGKFLINNKNEFVEHNTEVQNKFWAKYYFSYFPNTKIFICIRFFIINDELVDFFVRPSNNWNVHTGNQIIDKNQLYKFNDFFEKYINTNKKYISNILKELYDILGNGFYTHDFLFVDNKLILCELGYKILDPKLIWVCSENNIQFKNKISTDMYKVQNKYKDFLLYYKTQK